MRKLASVRRIDAINPIPDADAIEVATIGGWNVVVKKGDFRVNDLCVYFEIDSWVPTTLAPFLTKPGHPVRVYCGVAGERLRTIKLRGQVSQGLILSTYTCEEYFYEHCGHHDEGQEIGEIFYEDADLTEILGIQKYEPTLPASLGGVARGNFPSFIPKTDQERIQNMSKEFGQWYDAAYLFEITEKVDGSSMTVYVNDGKFGVCSRNLDLIETSDNTFWQVARSENLESKMIEIKVDSIEQGTVFKLKNYAIQGELIGPGIQKNKYNLKKHLFLVFDIWDIDRQCYLNAMDRNTVVNILGLWHVPVITYSIVPLIAGDIPGILAYAERDSLISAHFEDYVVNKNPVLAEGVVFKCIADGKKSFKTISNKWLMKNDG